MLFGTGPSAGSVGPTGPHPYSPYSHASSVGTSTSQAPSFKSLHPTLMNNMLHVTSPNSNGPSQSELIASLNTYHHHQHNHQQLQPQPLQHSLEGSMGSAGTRISATCGDNCKVSVGNSSRESPGVSHRTQTASPSSSSGGTSVHHGNQNEVRSCMLYGIPIVSLVMDGQERLCLAQISNTLLKSFSYNEIHNRRVALGITCVQCTPVQLELLRRAGAMPVSSRRCGMITKRESERLCKSFLAEAEPPKLPDSFAFDVYHSCAWGCRGSFTPSRYNSSRAKCIKCIYCGLFFSPNKFIFHSHRLPTSKYIQPDAANFNSWRRHIRLVSSPEPPEHVSYAWEDVKAMFNGGSRKRAMSSTLNSFTKNQESNSKANAAHKHEQAKYKYSDDNSGLDDSDDYCSLDGTPLQTSTAAASHLQPLSSKKIVMTGGQNSNDSDQGTNSGSQLEELEQMNNPSLHCMSTAAGALNHHHPYHPFAQVNSKSIFESHFKKAFEVNSVGGCQTKQIEAESRKLEQTGNHSPPHLTSSPLLSPSPPIMKHQIGAEPSAITDHLSTCKTAESMMMHSPPFSSPSAAAAAVLPPTGHAAYLAAAAAAAAAAGTEQATLMANYNGLFGGHHFNQRAPAPAASLQLSDSRLHSGTHPAILSTLLNGMPETTMTATQQLRAASGLLSSSAANYMQMAPSMMAASQQLTAGAGAAVGSANRTSGTDLSCPPPIGAPGSTDFRHNLAEFMWSMAASKAGSTPYNFFWPHAAAAAAASAVPPPPHPAVMSAPQIGGTGSSLAPLSTTNTSQTSSSASSTPTLSPNHVPPSGDTSVNPQEIPPMPNGGLFSHFGKSATANAEDIRKALLLNTGLLHQQHNVATHFPPFHSNASMPFLPNLMGHNLRLMPPNHSTPSYMLTNKENTEVENGLPLQNKSPEMRLNSTSSQSLPPTPLSFPFRSAFTSPVVSGGGGTQNGTALDRFSSEALLRNQALLFDAYHGNGGTSQAASFFNPGLFSGSNESSKQRYENSNAREADKSEKSVDVISGDNGETASMLRSMYHSFSTSAKATAGHARTPANGSTKFSRRNLKRTSQDSSVNGNKKTSSAVKGKLSPLKKAMKSDLPIFEASSVEEEVVSGMNGKNLEVAADGSHSCISEEKKTEELEQTNSSQNAEMVCDAEESCSLGVESPKVECQSSRKSSPSPPPSQCSPSPPVIPPSLGNTAVSPASQPSPIASSVSTNQTPTVSMQLVL